MIPISFQDLQKIHNFLKLQGCGSKIGSAPIFVCMWFLLSYSNFLSVEASFNIDKLQFVYSFVVSIDDS